VLYPEERQREEEEEEEEDKQGLIRDWSSLSAERNSICDL
jgi:hypothetical protein